MYICILVLICVNTHIILYSFVVVGKRERSQLCRQVWILPRRLAGLGARSSLWTYRVRDSAWKLGQGLMFRCNFISPSRVRVSILMRGARATSCITIVLPLRARIVLQTPRALFNKGCNFVARARVEVRGRRARYLLRCLRVC